MKNTQKIILCMCYLAVFFLASPAYLQAQTTHTGDLSINADVEIPSNVDAIIIITGNLAISGTITAFPDFAALRVIEGNLVIEDITTADLTDIFPALKTIHGHIDIQSNNNVQTITGFEMLTRYWRRSQYLWR